jgi:ferredoxin
MTTATAAATHAVEFPGSAHPPLRLAAGAALLEHLTIENSPVLFGCRNGICGTCAVRVEARRGGLAPPGPDEADLVALVCPGAADVRLACQLHVTADLRIAPAT